MRHLRRLGYMAVLIGLLIQPCQAVTMDCQIAVDNVFSAYLSESDSTVGTRFASGYNWANPVLASVELVYSPAKVYYLHIDTADVSGTIAGFAGEFSLTGEQFAFPNGRQTIATFGADYTYWQVRSTSFTGPLLVVTQVPFEAQWGFSWINNRAIWTNQGHDLMVHRYFSIPISAQLDPTQAWVPALGNTGAAVLALAFGLILLRTLSRRIG